MPSSTFSYRATPFDRDPAGPKLPSLLPPAAPPPAAADLSEALGGLGGDEPRIKGLRFLGTPVAAAAVTAAGVEAGGGALAAFPLPCAGGGSGAERLPRSPPAPEEAALILAAAAAAADTLARGGLTESRWGRAFPRRPLAVPPADAPRGRALAVAEPGALLVGGLGEREELEAVLLRNTCGVQHDAKPRPVHLFPRENCFKYEILSAVVVVAYRETSLQFVKNTGCLRQKKKNETTMAAYLKAGG